MSPSHFPFFRRAITQLLQAGALPLLSSTIKQTIIPNPLTQTNLDMDTGVPSPPTHIQIPDLPISAYMHLGEACRANGGQIAAAGEGAGVAVLFGICRHYSLHSEHLRRLLADMQARGINMASAYVPGGPLPTWVTTLPEIIVDSGELGWMPSLSHSLQCLWGCLQGHPLEAVVVAILVAVAVRQLWNRNGTGNDRKNHDDNEGPPIREDEIPVSRPSRDDNEGPPIRGDETSVFQPNHDDHEEPPIRGDDTSLSQPIHDDHEGPPIQGDDISLSQPSYPPVMGGPGSTIDPVTLINMVVGHLTPTQASGPGVNKKRKATDEVSADGGEAEHVSKKRQASDSAHVVLITPTTNTAETPEPAPRKKRRGRPRKHNKA